MTIGEFAEAAVAYCRETGGSVTSGYRTAAHNARVGGVANSRHLRGLAVDVVYDTTILQATADAIADRFGLRIVHEGDHDHLQPKG